MAEKVICPECYKRFPAAADPDTRSYCPHCGAEASDSNVKTYSLDEKTDPFKDSSAEKSPYPQDDETDFDETPRRQRRTGSKPSESSYDNDDDGDDDDGDRRPSNKASQLIEWVRSQNLELVIWSIGITTYLVFILLSFLWPPMAILSICVAGLGAVAYFVIFHATLLHGGGVGALLLYLLVPFYALYYLANNIDDLGKPFLLYIICLLGMLGAYFRVPSTEQVNQVNVVQNKNHNPGPNRGNDRGGVNPRPGDNTPKPAGKGNQDQKPKVTENPVLTDKGISYLSDLKEFDYIPGADGWGFGKNGDLGDSRHSRIQTKNTIYTKALGMHPPNRGKYTQISYDLSEKAQEFKGAAAMSDSSHAASSVRFEVFGDKQSLWKSKLIQKLGDVDEFTIDVGGIKLLQLRVYVEGPNNFYCDAVWLDPYIVEE
jgi:hypothetical protein